MKKYKVISWNNIEIHEMEIIKETKNFVIYKYGQQQREAKEAKETEHHCYFDTWKEAHLYLLQRLTNKIRASEERLSILKDEFRILSQMKEGK